MSLLENKIIQMYKKIKIDIKGFLLIGNGINFCVQVCLFLSDLMFLKNSSQLKLFRLRIIIFFILRFKKESTEFLIKNWLVWNIWIHVRLPTIRKFYIDFKILIFTKSKKFQFEIFTLFIEILILCLHYQFLLLKMILYII